MPANRTNAAGSRRTIPPVAASAVEDARTLYVNPWDKGQVKPIEKAITLADFGVSVGSDANGVRVSFPDLTTERRKELTKLVRAKLEEARIAVKNIRTKAHADIEKSGASEDEERRLKSEVQKVVDETNKKLDELAEKKEKELLS